MDKTIPVFDPSSLSHINSCYYQIEHICQYFKLALYGNVILFSLRQKNLNKTIIEKNISYTNVLLKDNVYLRDERNEKWEQ